MNDVERKAWRREQIERWLASEGMGVEEWCRLNRMSTSTFYLWLNRFRDEEPEVFGARPAKGWVEVARQVRKDSMALATTGPAAKAAADDPGRAGRGGGGQAPITVAIAGATVTVPAGSAAADVANVMRAVMGA